MKVAYVNVFVTDLSRALGFYKDALGLYVQFTSPEHGYASVAAGDIRLGLAVPTQEQKDLIGRHTGIGFEVPDLEREYLRLKELGVTFTMPPAKQPWGGFMALVSDPDGNVFYLDQVNLAHS